MADVAALIKNQMAKIGVEAKINLVDSHCVCRSVLGQARLSTWTVTSFGDPARYQPALGELLPRGDSRITRASTIQRWRRWCASGDARWIEAEQQEDQRRYPALARRSAVLGERDRLSLLPGLS